MRRGKAQTSGRHMYPVLALGSAVGFLIVGMALANRRYYVLFLVQLCLLFVLFGYGKMLLRVVFTFIPVSLFFMLLSCAVNRSMSVALPMAMRVFLVGICVVPSLGMPQVRLIRNLNQLHCPRMLTLGMLIAVRFVPVVGGEVRQIRDAMKTRGVRASLFDFRCFYRALLIPLTMRLINISDMLSMSLETRGFSLEKTPVTIYEPVAFTVYDGVYLLLAAALSVLNLLLLP